MAGWKRTVIAHHEAGHAVIARKLGISVVQVIVRGDRAALTHSAGWLSMSDADVEARVAAYESDAVVALAGLAAQRVLQGREDMFVTDSLFKDDADMANALNAIYCVICLRTGKPLPTEPTTMTLSTFTVEAMTESFDRLRTQAICLVRAHWPAIARVAKALERHDRIDQTELDRLIAAAE
jgi:hypothetical protein